MPNAPKWYEMHHNLNLGSNGGGLDMFVAKTSDATSWHELMQERSARFLQSFVRKPNDPECTQIVRNAPKRQFRVQWGGSGAFVAKNSDATSWHELLH